MVAVLFMGVSSRRRGGAAASNYDFFDAAAGGGFSPGFLTNSSSAFERVSREVRHLLISLRNARAFSDFSRVELSMP
jgi:hypothetical protein